MLGLFVELFERLATLSFPRDKSVCRPPVYHARRCRWSGELHILGEDQRFNGEALASMRFSSPVRSCASISIGSRVRSTKSIMPPCTRSYVSQLALRPPNFA